MYLIIWSSSLLLLWTSIVLCQKSPYGIQDMLYRSVAEKDRLDPADLDTLEFYNLLKNYNLPSRRFSDRPGKDYEIPSKYELGFDNLNPIIRDQEYLQHSSLWGHQFVSGGTGEGVQRVKPEGSAKNSQEVKTDAVLPAYCDPPNPCPMGYSAEDGCLMEFENTAEFSRIYQSNQDCMCDTEHMFNCPTSTQSNELDALANSIQRHGITDQALNRLMDDFKISGKHDHLVAKKFNKIQASNEDESSPFPDDVFQKIPKINPYLTGEKLPIAAKKGIRIEDINPMK